MVSVQEEAAQLGGQAEEWEIERAEERPRAAAGPDGTPGAHLDAVLVLRKR